MSEQTTPGMMITGHVRDNKTEEALTGAHIVAYQDGEMAYADGDLIATVSDADGYYEIHVPVDVEIRASFVGYQTMSFEPEDDTEDIYLDQTPTNLPEAVVTGTRKATAGLKKHWKITAAVTAVLATAALVYYFKFYKK